MISQAIGIMTTKAAEYKPFPEAHFYAALAEQAAIEKLPLFVFFPESVSLQNEKINGYKYVDGNWVQATFPFPKIIYDRVFYNSSYYQKNKEVVCRLKEQANVIFMNRGLPSKWGIYQQLLQDTRIRSHLPRQELFTNKERLDAILHQQPSIIIKPIAGGFGKKVLHLTSGIPTILEGRNSNNRFFRKTFNSQKEAIDFITPKLSRRFLIQQYLELNTPEGNPYDVRIFVQKNAIGKWSVIGKGVRIGPKHQLTSNIRGGGKAISYQPFINKIHPSKYQEIAANIEKIGILVPQILEIVYSPLFELGIDVGIDRWGEVWILEANAKPGRKIFELMGDHQASLQALKGPIIYAKYLLEREQGGSV